MEPWRRNFHAVWPSLFATSMGLMAFLPVLTAYVGERFGIDDPEQQAFWGGLVYGVAPISAAIAGPVWGAFGDRIGKKPMAIRANVAIALTTLLMPFAGAPGWLLLLRAVQGVLAGYVAPAMALVSQDAPVGRHGRIIARLQVAMALGLFLGPVLGAEVTVWWGRRSLFFVTSAFSGLAALQLWLFAREAPPATAGPRPPFVRELWQSSLQLLQNRVFAWLLLLVLALRLGQNMLEPFVVEFVGELGPQRWIAALSRDAGEALERTNSAAFAVLAVAQLLFTPLWGRMADRYGPLRCLAVLGLSLGTTMAATAAVAGIDQFLLLRTVAACFMAGSMTLAYAAASKRVVAARRTLAFSMVQSCMQFGFGFGALAGAGIAGIGATEQHANLRLCFLVAGAVCILAGVGMLLLRRLPAGRDEHAPPVLGAERT